MVKGLFLQVLNMSFTASIVILAVLLLRLPSPSGEQCCFGSFAPFLWKVL